LHTNCSPCPPGEALTAYRGVMSLHKLTAGDGYTYLTRQVAATDATHIGHLSLGDFYASKGESPGRWTGSGLSSLAGMDAGDPVSAEQMKALFGEGRHPNADAIAVAMIAAGHSRAEALHESKLGSAFFNYPNATPLRVAVSRRFVGHNKSLGLPWNASISADVRTRIRTEVGAEMFVDARGRPPADQRELSGFIAGHSRKPRTAVAGYDLTFSPVKSVSCLWAIASPDLAAQIQEAHQGAIADTLGWLEREAAFARAGALRGRPSIEVTGLIAAAFTHRDARSGDPDLHTHVAVSNKVQTLDGAWMSVCGRVLFKAAVAASERYNTRIEAELIDRLGVRFEARPGAGIAKRPIREIVGVSPALNAHWSSRGADIAVRTEVLSDAFLVDRGRPPTTIELLRLNQRANLGTRAARHSPRSHANQRATWRAQAEKVLGSEGAVEAMITLATGSRQPGRTLTTPGANGRAPTGQWVTQTAAAVVARVAVSHPTWQMWHVRAEAERAARTAGTALADVNGAVDAVVACALSPANSFLLAGPEPVPDPDIPRRRDGSSVYTVPGAARYISMSVIGAKGHLGAAPQPRNPSAAVVEVADDEALFHAAYQREYSPGPDLDIFDTERQLVEANKWDHARFPQARLLELNELAADFFAAGYADSWGPAYVSSRLGTDLADHPSFRLGYAPAGWTHLSDRLRDLGASDQEILAAGLARVATTGHIIDQFRGRLMLPIRNGQQIHGFIGRSHPAPADHAKAGPKYLNTARTDLFDKGAQLFGLTEGRAALEAGATPVLVEGSFDAIAVTLATGGRYVGLASLGTSITATQAGTLRPYIGSQRPGVTVATDADLAGQIAAERAFWMLTARGDTPRQVLLPDGQDPAAVLQQGGPGVLRAYLDQAQPLARQLLDERLNHLGDSAQLVPQCAAIIAAQTPPTWAEHIDYAAARTSSGRGFLQQAVAGAARAWTLDPLAAAQTQIGNLSAVRTRLQQCAQLGLSTDGTPELDLAAGRPAGAGHQNGQPSGTHPFDPKASSTTTPPPPPVDAWRQLAHSINPALTAGDDWPMLWRAVQEADTAGYDVAAELAALATGEKLSRQRPATELAYRLRAATESISSDIEPAPGPDPTPAAVTSLARPAPFTRPSRRPPSQPMRRPR
jgi:DNA primase catalytic core